VWSREEIVELVPPVRMSYIMLSLWEGARGYRSTVEVVPDGRGGTDITWRSSFEPVIPGTGPIVRTVLRSAVAGLARRLAAG
jgi:hypothetical protein